VLEAEIGNFLVVDHDGTIVGCAALYPIPGEKSAEFACLAVAGEYRDAGYGERLLKACEERAKALRLRRLFALTTSAAHWFLEQGFRAADVPPCRSAAKRSTTGAAARRCSSREYNSRHGANGEVREARREAKGSLSRPNPGALGQRIWENVSKEAWQQWLKHQTMLVNENRLNLADPKARKYLNGADRAPLLRRRRRSRLGYVRQLSKQLFSFEGAHARRSPTRSTSAGRREDAVRHQAGDIIEARPRVWAGRAASGRGNR